MKIAIVGSGISGNTLAHLLFKNHDITLFEKNDRLGGHSHTHEIKINKKKFNVDTGFIVFNKATYPLFTNLLDELNVRYENSNMSFSVFSKKNNFEYNGTSLNTLFSQRKNILNYKFLKMIYEIIKFNKISVNLLSSKKEISLGDFLNQNQFSDYFCKNYILPMGSAIWSTNISKMLEFPAIFFINFFKNHGMLNINDRPQWLTISGGSKEYVKKLTSSFKKNIKLNCKILSVERNSKSIIVNHKNGKEKFDFIIFACHSDEALNLIKSPTLDEKKILSTINYSQNTVTLHTDKTIMPNKKLSWAAWNYNIDNLENKPIALTYNMNILQNLNSLVPILVTLNDDGQINPKKIIKNINYSHPLFTLNSVKAQKKHNIISGKNRTAFAGAYWGNGFHEDGIKSAHDVFSQINKFLK
ncbi:MAG: FAD-dependent oxidoreductase [Nitrosomonadales bacterium]|nr:FAD-dependent oxidoreductase [Nitrosomonadales bacterium]|tara:strand:- start:14277 stop:15518 length:1242 start_codon:yes stop_codon:yes gene_type:complete